jgi:hypothetical protein
VGGSFPIATDGATEELFVNESRISSDLCPSTAEVWTEFPSNTPQVARVLVRVLKIEIREFTSVFECSRVLNLAINAHEIILYNNLAELSRQRS